MFANVTAIRSKDVVYMEKLLVAKLDIIILIFSIGQYQGRI